ncbi:MAG: DsbC/DsbD-like thiol-disulfide interchange protein [Yoonia sp.]|jgi:DsbC/DsbD-like thiol-disulfide interchange protein
MKKLALLALMASPAYAGPTDHDTTLTVLSGPQTSRGSVMAGLRIDMADGWKTYWRAPGDAGIPPQIQWSGSMNVGSIAFHWPVPEVFDQDGMRSIGYHDTVTIPVEIFPNDAGEIHLSGSINIGVCEEICVPVNLEFDTVLPLNEPRDPAITAALLNRPLTASEASVGTVTCTIKPTSDGMQITTRTALTQQGPEAIIIETSDPFVWVSEPDVTRTATHITATSDLIHVDGTSFAVDRSGIRITVLGQGRAVDIQGCTAS